MNTEHPTETPNPYYFPPSAFDNVTPSLRGDTASFAYGYLANAVRAHLAADPDEAGRESLAGALQTCDDLIAHVNGKSEAGGQ